MAHKSERGARSINIFASSARRELYELNHGLRLATSREKSLKAHKAHNIIAIAWSNANCQDFACRWHRCHVSLRPFENFHFHFHVSTANTQKSSREYRWGGNGRTHPVRSNYSNYWHYALRDLKNSSRGWNGDEDEALREEWAEDCLKLDVIAWVMMARNPLSARITFQLTYGCFRTHFHASSPLTPRNESETQRNWKIVKANENVFCAPRPKQRKKWNEFELAAKHHVWRIWKKTSEKRVRAINGHGSGGEKQFAVWVVELACLGWKLIFQLHKFRMATNFLLACWRNKIEVSGAAEFIVQGCELVIWRAQTAMSANFGLFRFLFKLVLASKSALIASHNTFCGFFVSENLFACHNWNLIATSSGFWLTKDIKNVESAPPRR